MRRALDGLPAADHIVRLLDLLSRVKPSSAQQVEVGPASTAPA
jgi:hypothetical protein